MKFVDDDHDDDE